MFEEIYDEALHFVEHNSNDVVARQMAKDVTLMYQTLLHLQQVRERLEQHELALRMENETP